MHALTLLTPKNTRPLFSGIAVGSAGLGLRAALGAFAAPDVVPADPDPQYEMHSAAKVKFLNESETTHVWTSDAWLANGMGKAHVPMLNMHR